MSVTYDVLNAKVSRHDLIDPRPSDVFSIAYLHNSLKENVRSDQQNNIVSVQYELCTAESRTKLLIINLDVNEEQDLSFDEVK